MYDARHSSRRRVLDINRHPTDKRVHAVHRSMLLCTPFDEAATNFDAFGDKLVVISSTLLGVSRPDRRPAYPMFHTIAAVDSNGVSHEIEIGWWPGAFGQSRTDDCPGDGRIHGWASRFRGLLERASSPCSHAGWHTPQTLASPCVRALKAGKPTSLPCRWKSSRCGPRWRPARVLHINSRLRPMVSGRPRLSPLICHSTRWAAAAAAPMRIRSRSDGDETPSSPPGYFSRPRCRSTSAGGVKRSISRFGTTPRLSYCGSCWASGRSAGP